MIRMLAGLAVILAATPASAAWLEARTGHFTVYEDASEDGIRAFATKLERFDAGMRRLRDLPDRSEDRANPLIVYVVPTVADVQRLCKDGRADKVRLCTDVAGFYQPRATGSVAFTPKSAGADNPLSINAQIVLFHEYTHHFMLENFGAAYPAWFIEGFAEFNSTATFATSGAIGFGKPALHRYYGLMTAAPLPLATILTGDNRSLSRDQREMLYGRGWLLTHFLTFDSARQGQLAKYLAAINAGTPALDAATATFGDLTVLDHDLDAYLRRRRLQYLELAPAKVPVGDVTVRALTAGEAATIAVRMRSQRGVDAASAAAVVVEARRAAASYAADPGAQVALAEAEFDAGDLAAADAAAARALAADPGNRAAMLFRGQVAARTLAAAKSRDAAGWKAARSWFARANKREPDAAAPLMFYYRSFLGEGVRPPPLAVAGLERAFDLAPQDRGLRFMLARQYLIDGKPKEARTIIAPLAFDPHAPADNPAKRLLARIDAGDTAAATTLANGDAEGDGD